MANQRDYAAEYARRIARGAERGLSRSQARGHPRVTERLASGRTPHVDINRALEEGVKLVRSGKPLSTAARSIGTAPERLRNYAVDQGIAAKVGGRWRIGEDNRLREMPLYSTGEMRVVVVKGYDAAAQIGEYMSAVGQFLSSNDISVLDPYKGRFVTDVNGQRHYLEVRPNVLYVLDESNEDTFEDVYRIIS